MQPEPFYDPAKLHPAFELRYSWTGWLCRAPLGTEAAVLKEIESLWESDGMRLLEHYWSDDKVQLTFSATPQVSPVFLAGRAKGRLQHALRRAAPGFSGFSRKVSICSVGHNYAMGQVRIWTDTYYAGTFGEYDMWAIRCNESPR